MLANVGRIDRAIRILLGVALLVIALAGPKVAWGWIGLAPLLSGAMRHCPLYALLGISTCRHS